MKMTHAEVLKQLKPYITITFKDICTDKTIQFYYTYGEDELYIQYENFLIDTIKVPKFSALIQLRSVAAKWIRDNGYAGLDETE